MSSELGNKIRCGSKNSLSLTIRLFRNSGVDKFSSVGVGYSSVESSTKAICAVGLQ